MQRASAKGVQKCETVQVPPSTGGHGNGNGNGYNNTQPYRSRYGYESFCHGLLRAHHQHHLAKLPRAINALLVQLYVSHTHSISRAQHIRVFESAFCTESKRKALRARYDSRSQLY